MYETAGYYDGAYLYYGLRCDTMQLVDMAQSFWKKLLALSSVYDVQLSLP